MINQLRLPWKQKDESYPLVTFDGSPVSYDGGTVQRETAQLSLAVRARTEQICLDITGTTTYPVILGIPWLQQSNPRIDWASGQLYWEDEPLQCPRRRNDLASEEDRPEPSRKSRRFKAIAAMTQQEEIGYPGQEEPSGKTPKTLEGIPEEYHQFAKVFQGRLDTRLPQHSE